MLHRADLQQTYLDLDQDKAYQKSCLDFYVLLLQMLAQRLLQVQKDLQEHDPKIKLISDQELIAIQVNWYRDFNFGYSVSEIYNSIYNTSLIMEENSKNKLEADLMREICKDDPEEGELIEQLLLLQRSKSLMKRRRGLPSEIETRIREFVNKKQQ